jgi:hypothetical protein
MTTPEEINDSLVLKLAKKLVTQKFKWVKDIKCGQDPNRYSSLIFLDLYFDPFLFAEEYNLELMNYVKRLTSNSMLSNVGGSLCVYVKEPICTDPLYKEIDEKINAVINTPLKTSAVPNEYKKVFGGKQIHISRNYISKESMTPPTTPEED